MMQITLYFGDLESGKRVDLLTSKRDLSFEVVRNTISCEYEGCLMVFQ